VTSADRAMRGVVLLDRDGVLNVDRAESVTSVDELEVLPGACEGVQLLAGAGFAPVVVTNQACVGRGQLSLAELEEIDAELDRRLDGRLAGFFVCPHTATDHCACRKPGTVLLEQARAAWSFDPSVTWFVADDGRDIEAARRFGCRPALVRTGKGAATASAYPDVPVFDDLVQFARFLVSVEDG
jgi:D-glycero-D-manno-heptose 1,7-bisphosphate phosphatase